MEALESLKYTQKLEIKIAYSDIKAVSISEKYLSYSFSLETQFIWGGGRGIGGSQRKLRDDILYYSYLNFS